MGSLDPSPVPLIESRILLIRGQKVPLDSDLAKLCGVPTGRLNEAVKRNSSRFPDDFMFRLTNDERKAAETLRSLRSQKAILNTPRGQHRKYAPYVFTEQGIAMLSSVLSSDRAILVNIAIMRTSVRLRQILASHHELAERLEHLEWRQSEQASEIHRVFETIQQLIVGPDAIEPKRRIGSHPPERRLARKTPQRPSSSSGTSDKRFRKVKYKIMENLHDALLHKLWD